MNEEVRNPGTAEETERLFQAYFEASSDALVVYSPDGRQINVNRAACELHRGTRAEMLAASPRDFFALEAQDAFDDFQTAIAEATPFHGDVRARRLDGRSFEAEVRGQFVAIGERRYFLASHVDVSELRRKEAEEQHDTDYRALVADLSSRLLRTNVEAFDRAIGYAFARIGEIFDVDFCEYWYLVEGPQWILLHRWTIPPWLPNSKHGRNRCRPNTLPGRSTNSRA